MAISTNGTVLARLAGGLYNTTLSNATYAEVNAVVKTAADINTLANDLYARDFASKTDLSVATTLLSNLGLSSVAGLANWVAAQITAAGAANKGAKVVSMLNDFANMTSDATYGAAATSFNTKTTAALALSQKDGSAGGDFNVAAAIAAADAAAAAAAAAAKAAADAAAAKAAADAAATKAAADAAAAAAAEKAAADAAAEKAAADAAAAAKAAADAAAVQAAADAAAKAAADAAAAAELAPQTFTLTTGLNSFTGKSGADTFDGSLGGSAGSTATLNSFDSLNGAAGTDILSAAMTGGTVSPTLTAIETLIISNTAASTAATLDLVNASGYTTLENNGSTFGLTFANVSSAAGTFNVTNVDGQSTTFGLTTAASTGATTSTVNLSNVTGASTVAIAGVETLTLNSAGSSANVLGTLTDSSLTTLKVTGSQQLTVTNALPLTTTTVDASAATGKVAVTLDAALNATVTGGSANDTLTVSAVTNNVSVNGGAGNDTIVGGSNLTATDSIDGGAGTADRLSTTIAAATVLDAATPTTYNITNIEQLTISDVWSGTGTAADDLLVLANIATGIDTVNLAATSTTSDLTTTNAVSITGPAGSLAVNLGGSLASNTAQLGAALTLTDTGVGTTDSLTLTNLGLNGTTALNMFNGYSMTSTGYENVTINSGAATTTATGQTIATLTITPDVTAGASSTATSLTLTGANSVAITSLSTNSTGTMTVDASALTAQPAGTSSLTISGTTAGTAGKFNITGTGGQDSITLGAFSATVSGGLGNDTITTGSAASSVSGGDGVDNITGGSGSDTLLGGDGNDTISTGNGANKVDGGNGADTITAGNGADSILGGAGDDRIIMGSNLTNTDTIDGGDGTDTLVVTEAPTATTFGNVTGIEVLAVSGSTTSVSMSSAIAGLTSFDLTDTDNQYLTFATGYTGATTVNIAEVSSGSAVSSNDRVINTANVALTVNGGETNFDASTSITGGSGVDTLNITADSGSANLTLATKIDVINILPNATTASLGAILTLSTNDPSQSSRTLTVNASALTDASATFTFDAGAGLIDNATSVIVTGATAANTIKATANGTSASSAFNVTTYAGADTIIGGSGNDVIDAGNGANSIVGASGNDSLKAGTGSDSFVMAGADLTSDDTIDGGAGTNSIKFSTNGAVIDDDFTNITNIQTVTSVGAALNVTLDALADASGVVTVTMISGYADSVTIGADFDNALAVSLAADTAALITDSFDASESLATISLTSSVAGNTTAGTNVKSITSVDTLIAGEGTADKITLTAYFETIATGSTGSTDSVVVFGSDVSGWETVQVNPNATYSYADISITTADEFVAADSMATIDATRLVDSGATLTFSGANETSSTSAYSVVGGNGNDTITGGAGNDTVDGGAGDDNITGGAGGDNLSGGAGNDTFVIATTSDFTTDNETISGGSGNDILSFTGSAASTLTASDLANVSGIETITFAGNYSATMTLTDALYANNGVANLSISHAAATDTVTTITASTLSAANSVTLDITGYTGSASNVISLGAGDDTVKVDLDIFDAAQTIAGGAGNDTLNLFVGGTGVLGSGVTGFETITFGTVGDTYGITTNSATVAAGATLTVSGSSLTAALTFNGAAETNGYFSITGGTGADVITGGSLADTIVTGAGADTITGGAGADIMTGGTGTDVFNYNGAGFETGTLSPVVVYYGGVVEAGVSISTAGLDKILDFSAVEGDSIITNAPGNTLSATSGVNKVGSAWTDEAGFLRGTYSATAQTFVFSTTGRDSIFAYDFDGDSATTDMRAIVLVGYVDSDADDVMTSGLTATAA